MCKICSINTGTASAKLLVEFLAFARNFLSISSNNLKPSADLLTVSTWLGLVFHNSIPRCGLLIENRSSLRVKNCSLLELVWHRNLIFHMLPYSSTYSTSNAGDRRPFAFDHYGQYRQLWSAIVIVRHTRSKSSICTPGSIKHCTWYCWLWNSPNMSFNSLCKPAVGVWSISTPQLLPRTCSQGLASAQDSLESIRRPYHRPGLDRRTSNAMYCGSMALLLRCMCINACA